jgi:HAD superfamily hydrolase (TIGR01509 family)
MGIFAVLFDMDGLMLDTERMARVAWKRALAEQGYQLDDHNYLRMVGRTVQDARLILRELFGQELPFQKVFDMRQAYYDADIEQNGIPIKPGLLELLDFLEAQLVPKAVASSTPCWFATHKLARAGIDARFKAIVCGDMVTQGKPAPDLFLEAARQIAMPPERCVVLEDSEAGITAAHAAGMVPVMVPDLKQPTPEILALAYRVLPSLYEVIPLMGEFIQVGLPA